MCVYFILCDIKLFLKKLMACVLDERILMCVLWALSTYDFIPAGKIRGDALKQTNASVFLQAQLLLWCF